MEMVILVKKVNIFKDFTNILFNNLFSGSSLNTSSNSCTPRQVYRDRPSWRPSWGRWWCTGLVGGGGLALVSLPQAEPDHVLLCGAVHHVSLHVHASDRLGPAMARHGAASQPQSAWLTRA
jgi:hypothetical protein